MPNKPTSINLLRGKEKSFLDKFITWALSYGRLVIIITEGIALGAFLFRFGLDAKLVDLHDKIKQQQQIVSGSKVDEDKYRDLQARLGAISQLGSQAENQTKIYFDLINNIPADFLIEQIVENDSSIKIKAQVYSLEAFTTYITYLKDNKQIKTISIDSIENKPSTGQIITGLSIELNPTTK